MHINLSSTNNLTAQDWRNQGIQVKRLQSGLENAKEQSIQLSDTLKSQAKIGLFRNISFTSFQQSNMFALVLPVEISEMGKRDTIDTPFGEMKLALKEDGLTRLFHNNAALANFDVNGDGVVNSNDIAAKNLVLVGYDEDGNEIEINFLEATGGMDTTQFFEAQPLDPQSEEARYWESPWINSQSQDLKTAYHNAKQQTMGLATRLRPEESHQQLKKENVVEFFKSYADESGWIDFTNLDTFTKVFAEKGLDLSYRKTGADGSTRLERINFYTDVEKMSKMQAEGDRAFAWEYQAARALRGGGDDFVFKSKNPLTNGYTLNDRFTNLRNDLNELMGQIVEARMDSGSSQSNYLASRFYQLTGLSYSESNFEKVKEGLQSGGTEFLESLSNSSGIFVVGMQLDESSGKITMLFDSGKEVTIAIEDLYSGNGELTVDENGNRASVMNEAREMSEEELNDLDFSQVGAVLDERDTVVSLKELGITAIQKATYGDGRFLSFILTNADGVKFTTQDLFNMSFISSGGLDSRHQSDSNAESKSAFANVEDKNSSSTTSRMRKPHPIVFPTSPVDLHI